MRWLRGIAEETPETGELAPIRIFADEIELIGFVAPAGQRITDMLLRGQDLAFLPRGADPEPMNWLSISPHEMLMVVPPPLQRRTTWLAERDLRTVSLCVGPYRVRGTIHLAPGDDLAVDLRRRQSFLPLTRAQIDGDGASDRVEVVIVNLARARVEG
jgi:hypothetical protein